MTNVVTCPNCGTKNRVAPAAEGVPRCGTCHHLLPWLVTATADSFDAELRASVPVLVDFWAPWCGPCKWVSPLIDRLAAEHAGRLKVVKLNVDEAPAISARYGIQGIPTLVVHRDGAEVDRLSGAPPRDQLGAWVERHLGAAPASAASD
jgi:thioredoxin 2